MEEEVDRTNLFDYFNRDDNLMGTFAGCLPLLIHNLERYVGDLVFQTNHPDRDQILELTLKQKIDVLRGIPVRQNRKTFLLQNPVINAELWELLEDLREQRNSSVHVAGYLYNRIMRLNGMSSTFKHLSPLFTNFVGYLLNINNKSVKFSNTDATLKILLPQNSTHAAVVGSHGFQLNNFVLDAESTVEIGSENEHHFLLKVWTKKLFKENCKHLYAGEVTGDYVLVFYYGKLYSVYIDLKKSQILKIKEMFGIGALMPFIIYFKFQVNYFLTNL